MKQSIQSNTPWGKLKNNENEPLEWHPLIMHLIDVMATAEFMLKQPMIYQRLSKKLKLNDIQLKRICFLVALHDLGKFNQGFQNKAFPNRSYAGHVKEAFCVLLDPRVQVSFYETKGIGCQISDWFNHEYDLMDLYMKATICHHGKPIFFESDLNDAIFWPQDSLKQMNDHYQIILNLLGLSSNQNNPQDQLPKDQELIHAFSGLVTLADWIASGVEYFPYFEIENIDELINLPDLENHAIGRYQFALKQADLFFKDIHWNLKDRYPENHQYLNQMVTNNRLNEIFNFPNLKPFQVDIAEKFNAKSGTIEIIEAQTGDGKTEAALLRFCQYFNAGLVDGLYFALPTKTSATQIFQRIKAILPRIFPNATPELILAVGSVIDPQQEKILNYEKNTYDDLDPYHQKSKNWVSQSNKRFLVGTIVVGTIDQVLYSQLKVKHSHLRGFALLRHLLVVDEVHSSDTYMLEILKKVLAKQQSFGGTSLLLSATLTQDIKNKLFTKPFQTIRSTQAIREIPYPLLTVQDNQNPPIEYPLRFEKTKEFTVILQDQFDVLQIAMQAIELAKQGGKIAVIRNTVSDCILLQKTVEDELKKISREDLLFSCEGIPCPHHARFAQEDRRMMDIALEKEFANTKNPNGKLVIATQTIQQSLDIDFDAMITDLCPIDILIQRAGRIHRHQKKRLANFEIAKLYVLSPTSFFTDQPLKSFKAHGFGTIYPDFRILEATIREISRDCNFKFPMQSRLRIENALNLESIKAIEISLSIEQQAQFKAHESEIKGKDIAAHIQAHDVSYAWKSDFNDLSFDRIDEQYISARLGNQENFQVQFSKKVKTPFGVLISSLNIPVHFLYTHSSMDLKQNHATILNHDDEMIEFEIFNQKMRYHRFGIEKI